MRAVAVDAVAAQLVAVNVPRYSALAFAAGGAMVAASGTLISMFIVFNPSIGISYTLKALIVIILGGVGSHPVEAMVSEQAILGKKLTEETIQQAAAAAYPTAKPLDNTDFAMSWRKDMARYYVAGALQELGGLVSVTVVREGLKPRFPQPGDGGTGFRAL